MVNADRLVTLGIKALQNAFQVHEDLGDKGLKPVQKNPYGEISLVGDIEVEKAVIDTFRKAGVPLRIISEEHGHIDLTDKPEFLAILDGLDGTNVYKRARGTGRYGTMFGIFSRLDPTYGDYIFSGVMEHATKKLFYAAKNKGSFLLKNGEETKIICSSVKHLDKYTHIYVNENFDGAFNTTIMFDAFLSKLNKHELLHENSTAVYYVDLAQGRADLVIECTRQENLEIAAAFGLVNEAGGVAITTDGESIKNKRYVALGQKEHIAILSAATMELARALIQKVKHS